MRWAQRCGRQGWPRHAPYDRVWLSGGVVDLPATLADQLRPGGFVLVPLGRPHRQELVRATPRARGEGWKMELLGACRFEMLG